jgi:chromosome segregation ATPase
MFGLKALKIKRLKEELETKEHRNNYLSERLSVRRKQVLDLSTRLDKVSQQYIDANKQLQEALATVKSQQEEHEAIQRYYTALETENSALQLVVSILLTDLS